MPCKIILAQSVTPVAPVPAARIKPAAKLNLNRCTLSGAGRLGQLNPCYFSSARQPKYGVAIAAVLLLLFNASAMARDLSVAAGEGKTATAALRITLTIPPRTEVSLLPKGERELCMAAVAARFLNVRWLPAVPLLRTSSSPEPGPEYSQDKPIAALTGNASISGCISLSAVPESPSGQTVLLIAAE